MRYNLKAYRLWILFLFILPAALLAAWPPGKPVQSKSKISLTDSTTPGSSRMTPQVSQDPSIFGSWGAVQSLGTYLDPVTLENRPIVPVHINLLPDGRLLLWGRDKESANGYDIQGYTNAFVLDPFYMSFKSARNARTNLFCSGHSFLPDGRLLVAGGHSTEAGATQEGVGSRHTNIFDYRTGLWSPGPDMNNGRWYPYNLTLSSGETLVVAGSYWGRDPQDGQFKSVQNDVSQIYGFDGMLRDIVGLDASYPDQFGPYLRNYPFLHLLPNGQPYIAGASSSRDALFLNHITGSGEWEWIGGQPPNRAHHAGTSVQYDTGKIINIGGGSFTQTLNGFETIDLSNSGAFLPDQVWTPLASMGFPRVNHTGTLLPDGKVLVTGGSSCKGFNNFDCGLNGSYGGAVNTPELWTPGTGWQQMANHQIARGYHSMAILLPDGRVMIGGGGLPGAAGESPAQGVNCTAADTRAACRKFGHNDIEIFSPPYLFLAGGEAAPRPAITHAPREVTYGQNFTVGVGSLRANDISEVVLVRIGAVTHGFNQDQRRVQLTIASRSSDGLSLSVAAPGNSNVCPPGHYMLFLMKANGQRMTPSVAKIIRVGKVSTPRSMQVFAASSETREIDVSAVTEAANWTVSETLDPNNFITASRTATGKLSISVAANTGDRRKGQIRVKVQNQSVFDHVIDIYQGKNFTDISNTSTYVAASKLNALLITSGCYNGTIFCPDNNLTRAEMAVLLDRAILGVENPPPVTDRETFTDVPKNHWAHDFIEDIAKREITAGCNAQGPMFCPGDNVTRAQLAVFLLRVLNIKAPNPPTTTSFTDISSHWAYSFIEEAVQQGIMTGCQQAGKFCPEQPATRAEVAAALAKVLRL